VRLYSFIATAVLCAFFSSASAQQAWEDWDEQLDSLYSTASYEEGVRAASRALQQFPVTSTPNDSVRASVLEYYGMFAHELGRYSEAEEAFGEAQSLFARSQGATASAVASCLSQLAEIYKETDRPTDAIQASQKQTELYEKLYGVDHPNTILARAVLADHFLDANDLKRADALLEQCKGELDKHQGTSIVITSRFDNILGKRYFLARNYKLATQQFKRSLTNTSGIISYRYAERSHDCARAYLMLDEIDSADHFLSLAIKRIAEAPPYRPGIRAACATTAALLEEAKGNTEQAIEQFTSAISTEKATLFDRFKYTSERDELLFTAALRERLARFYSFALRITSVKPEIWKEVYNSLLFQKSIVFTNLCNVRRSIRSQGNTANLQLLDRLSTLRSRRARLVTLSPDAAKLLWNTADSLDQEIRSLEKQLTQETSILHSTLAALQVTSDSITHALAPDAAAIEIVRFPFYKGEERKDTAYYVALQLTKTSLRHAVIGDSRALDDSSLLRTYKRFLEEGKATATSTKLLYTSLDSLLGDYHTIYLSPDGIYQLISIASLPNGSRSLLDDHSFVILPSSRDILQLTKGSNENPIKAVIFANPDYDNGKTNLKTKNPLKPLPYTEKEASAIAALLNAKQCTATEYLNGEAQKKYLTALNGATLLHIATHARVNSPKRTSFQNTGLYSSADHLALYPSLYFAGANVTLANTTNNAALADSTDNGILTAWEAMELDLSKVDLVTLSACESGVGELVSGEGAMALGRAFLIAGAKSVLVSLWQVPDRETAELMEKFYSHYLDGVDKPNALRQAQLEMREVVKKRYGKDLPFYYSAFVLIGN